VTRRDLALSLLRDAGARGVTTHELLDSGVGSRYSARIRELRQEGHQITSERIREGSWRYTLESDVGREAEPVPLGAGLSSGGVPSTSPPSDAARLFDPPSRWDEVRERDAA
jgi:hypothetical protein